VGLVRQQLYPVAESASNLWYQDAVIYELHVRSFYDNDKSGTGDFAGLIQKLEYIQDLGVTAIWLLPFCPSPWLDDGYDVCDYLGVHPAYGTLDDFRLFVDACKTRSLRVITELVLNHTSNTHPWFERARHSPPGSTFRDYYVWSDTPDKYEGVRIIFKDFETSNWTWDPVAGAYYWHRFYSHQPDLNFDSPDVRQEIFQAIDFWLGMGVDGLRLDAVPYLFEREGTTCENLPETHQFLRELRRYIDTRHPGSMLLAEANQWPDDAVAYFGKGDECHMAFHFPLMPRLFMANRMEDSFPIVNILEQTPAIPANCQWATFLRNHDELTLEMVREEERDYMYRAYARDPEMRINLGIRRRLAPLVENDRRRIELMNALLFSLPGTPVIYYGDEIGMGENLSLGDRDGVRTPMQWDAGKNAGFSDAEEDRLFLPLVKDSEYYYEFLNVEAQEKKANSLLWWMRKIISIRKQSPALCAGSLSFLSPENRHVLAFIRRAENQQVLVVANLSRFAQSVELNLSEFAGLAPVEMFGGVFFRPIRKRPYPLSLAGYGFYWFELQPADVEILKSGERDGAAPPSMTVASFDEVLTWENRAGLAGLLLPFLRSANRHQPRNVSLAEIVDVIPLGGPSSAAVIAEVFFGGGDPELQMLPLAVAEGSQASEVLETHPSSVIALLQDDSGRSGLLYSGAHSGHASSALMSAVSSEVLLQGAVGAIAGYRAGPLGEILKADNVCILTEPQLEQQRNLSVLYSDLFVLKLFRRLEPGSNPDVDVVRFLFERAGFMHVAPPTGFLEYQREGEEPMVAGVMHAYVQNQQDSWQYTLEELSRFFDRALSRKSPPPRISDHPLDVLAPELPLEVMDLIQSYIEFARDIGFRTAQLHLALSSDTEDPAFAPEPFDAFYMRGVYHQMISTAALSMQALESRVHRFTPETQEEAGTVLHAKTAAKELFRQLLEIRSPGLRTRIHGDFHLGQVLYTGDDLVFIDFEGDNSRPLRERQLKRSPLQDVAGMLRSFHYAATSAVFNKVPGLVTHVRQAAHVANWANIWYVSVGSAFLDAYLRRMEKAAILPPDPAEFKLMLNLFLLEKAIYELGYELHNRPEWAPVALRGVSHIMHRYFREGIR
jgi:maltose alpha-D-glucosyltransferase/alpha-amylase